MKKIVTFIITAILAGNLCMNVSAEIVPENYYGHYEYVFTDGYIITMKDDNIVPDFDMLGVDNSKGYYDIFNVKLTDEEELGYDGRLLAYYNDEKFGGYITTDERTGYYRITGGTNYEKLSKNNDISEIYDVYLITRNGFDENYSAHELGGGYSKVYKHDELLKNDADDNGIVDSSDALKVLQAIVHENNFTIKEKIQLGITRCSNLVDYEDYNEKLTSEKALEILYQVVNE